MPRELGDERARYGRKGVREQLGDVLDWPREHRFAAGIIVIVIVGALLLAAVRGRFVDYRDLAVGDCLFVPTAAARDPSSTRPVGEPDAVVAVILSGGGERAACDASHGHEVSAVVMAEPLPTLCTPVPPCEMPSGVLDRAAIELLVRPACDAAFAGYVGRALAGSRYVTFPVAPEPVAWLAGGRRTVCLVARADGMWMDHPARGSGE